MAIFRTAKRTQRHRSAALTARVRTQVPAHFEATAEALAAGSATVVDACWVAGRALAGMGVPLADSLDGLRTTTHLVTGREPSYDQMHALAVSWSESTLGFVNSMSCADPLTGLSTLPHLRHRLSELYRDSFPPREHALVVAETSPPDDRMAAARSMTLLGRTARSVFGGSETIGQAGPARLIVVAHRDDALAPRVSLLRRMADRTAQRVWIEGLPHSDESAGLLLDELARGH